ncbi:hypothetical protein H6P81_020793 [Aristolochia fimbriata]|uniref:16S rRNA (uracil(1498)-N(3))-methyltransferase n=1 Tax=Aristolochia fimbriata TaxID=158543 RepID=A0AAV7DZN5_ARIFI|nr:hypothetical protein H6P81_020793 [Aristolochia fimbriata]
MRNPVIGSIYSFGASWLWVVTECETRGPEKRARQCLMFISSKFQTFKHDTLQSPPSSLLSRWRQDRQMRNPTVRPCFSKSIFLPWHRSANGRVLSTASDASAAPNQSRGGLPRFYSPVLPPSKDNIVRLQGDEFWHMTKVLRLKESERIELFNGRGGVIQGCIQKINQTGVDFIALEDPRTFVTKNTQWHVFAAFGTLKGGRADWLIEKCTELGASSVTPLLTDRSPTISYNRVERLQRVILAAVKQCQRLDEMKLNPPIKIAKLLPVVCDTKLSFLAAAEATSLISTLSSLEKKDSGLLIIGPEGDFTEKELTLMTTAGATPVGLGPCRLRVETATIALLATLMLWSDS